MGLTVQDGRNGSMDLPRTLGGVCLSRIEDGRRNNGRDRTEHNISGAHEDDVEVIGSRDLDG
jgi:hypothetical protein